jgi:hypothetical protein
MIVITMPKRYYGVDNWLYVTNYKEDRPYTFGGPEQIGKQGPSKVK